MGCGCNGGSKPNVPGPTGAKSWSLTLSDGTRTFFDSELAAKAANQKAGNKGLIRKVR